MKVLPWRLTGKAETPADAPDSRASTDESTTRRRPLPAWAARIIAVEPLLAPLCALILLLAPNPLIWPAAVFGMLPSAVRLAWTRRPWRATAFDLPFILLAIGAGLGGYASLNRDGAMIRLAGLLAAVVLFAALREHVAGERAIRRILLGSLVATVLATLLLLVLVGPFLLLERVPPLATVVAAVDPWGYRNWLVGQDWLLQRYRFRASGVGALADVGLALAVAALVGMRGRVPRLLAALTIPLFLLALVVADNRGAVLAGALTLGLMATVWRRRLLALVPVIAALALLIVALGPSDRGLNLRTLAQRFWFWENSVYLAREVPLTGAGLGLESVQLVYRGYFLPSYPPFSHAHNVYLQGLLEYGIVGLLGLIGLGLATLWLGWRASVSPDRWTMAGRLAGFGVAMAMLTTGLSEIVLHSTLGGVLAAIGFGLLAATGASGATLVSGARVPVHSAKESGAMNRAPTEASRVGARFIAPARRTMFVAAIGTVVLAMALLVGGVGRTVSARLLLNLGTADLNRATLSETIGRQDRATALNRSLDTLRLAASLTPRDAAIQRNLALALAANDEARDARTAADRAKAIFQAADREPASKADLLQLGRAYVATSTWSEAIRAWQAAEAAPQLIQLGNRLIRNRNFDQAMSAFIATARVDPQSRGAYEGVARAARERKLSTDETIAALGPLLERDTPTEFGAHLQAARILRDAGGLQDAVPHLQRAEQISAPAELSFESAGSGWRPGVPVGAEPLLVRPAADLPYEADSWFWLARAQSELGRYDDAVETIRQGLSRLDPSGQFAPPAERLPETAAVRAVEIRRAERAPLLGVMGESLVRSGRADEALPVLDEAVAALPKDAWLASTRAEALAVRSGAPPNLLFNPRFDRDGTWSIRPPEWVADDRWQMWMFLNETPAIENGEIRLAPATPESRVLVQDVFGASTGHRYRLTVRVRAEGLGDGAVVAFMTTSSTVANAEAVAQTRDAGQWTTLTLELEPRLDLTSAVSVGVGFGAGTRQGAVLWCDEATLVEVSGGR